MTNDSIDLGDVAAGASHIYVACSHCDRRGRYKLPRLVHTLGADFSMTDLGAELANCPHRKGRDAQQAMRCIFSWAAKAHVRRREQAS
jgi:hypothetical protein